MTISASQPAATSAAAARRVLMASDLGYAYGAGRVMTFPALHLAAGECCAVIGPSGSGKSTLLHLMAGLLRPCTGVVEIAATNLADLSESACDRFRGQQLGIVFQRLHLLPALTVLENLLLAQRLARVTPDAGAARHLLDELDILGLASKRPSSLSVGQAQRVAIARALVHRPKLLLADEPTSSLDDLNASRALGLLKSQAKALGAALLLVTHDQRVLGHLDREIRLEVRP